MVSLENEKYKVGLLKHGAELRSVKNKHTNHEYMWQADASVWNRSSPVLFPFVGRLKNDSYTHEGKTYHLPQHGFARNFDFELIELKENTALFELRSNAETLANYPFQFSLQLKYVLNENELSLSYCVVNKGDKEMYFSLGAHPAFNLSDDIEDYYLVFEKSEKFERLLLKSGLRNMQSEKVMMEENALMLKKEYFEQDAIVLQGMQSNEISIINSNNEKYMSLKAEGFPYYGIWSKAPFPFLCLEPWHGIADSVESTGELREKEGIRKLGLSEVFHSRITFCFFG